MSIERWRELQQDQEIAFCIEYLKQDKRNFDVNKLGSFKRYCKHFHLLHNSILPWKQKYVVPITLRSKILLLCHDHPAGIDRTIANFNSMYFWPNAYSDVHNWIHSCEKCNAFNSTTGGFVKVPLTPIFTTGLFELVCYDLAGPFIHATIRGNRYVLIIIVDHFSHWPEFFPLPDIKASTITRTLFDQWCCRYGIPEHFHSDGANNAHGYFVKELCKILRAYKKLYKILGSYKSKSSCLHPQCDGLSVAFVKVLKLCVQKQVETHRID